MRNEKKFLTSHFVYSETEDFLLTNKIRMVEIYQKRYINSIYFDTDDYQFFRTNVEGEHSRLKIRIRWYGDFDRIENPVLEYKIKIGEVVSKKLYPIPINQPLKPNDISSLLKHFRASCSDKIMVEQLKYVRPTLINRYFRGYYLSEDELVRATIDDGVEYYSPESTSFFYKANATIIELKYAPENESTAVNLANTMPFRLTKNSKYVQGISKLLWY